MGDFCHHAIMRPEIRIMLPRYEPKSLSSHPNCVEQWLALAPPHKPTFDLCFSLLLVSKPPLSLFSLTHIAPILADTTLLQQTCLAGLRKRRRAISTRRKHLYSAPAPRARIQGLLHPRTTHTQFRSPRTTPTLLVEATHTPTMA